MFTSSYSFLGILLKDDCLLLNNWYFRDGVSVGQFYQVMLFELDDIQQVQLLVVHFL